MLDKEVAATVALALDLTDDNWILKVRGRGIGEDPAEVPDDVWTGVLPLPTVAGDPEPTPGAGDALPVPPAVRALQERFSAPGRPR